jgi:hypothetical protein
VLPDLLEVQSDHSFHIESCVSGDEVCLLGDTVDDYHDCVIAMSWRKFDNEVDANDIPLVCCKSLQCGALHRVNSVAA